MLASLLVLSPLLAAAQEPTSMGAGTVTQTVFHLASPSDPWSAANDLAPALAVLPLRLSLQASLFPMAPGMGDDRCGVHGFPVQRSAVMFLTPRLQLHGFSSVGCLIDGAIGGGLTYVTPLRRDLWLVASAGIYGVPPHLPSVGQVHTDARLDVVKRTSDNRTYSVGIGKRGLTFGGSF
jgi:hypothetical protein